jgi:hypothetical protein
VLRKYQEGSCEKVWNEAKNTGYSIASLYWWAKRDNPDGYREFITSTINPLFEEAKNGTHDDIAKVVYELYKYTFKCSQSLKEDMV